MSSSASSIKNLRIFIGWFPYHFYYLPDNLWDAPSLSRKSLIQDIFATEVYCWGLTVHMRHTLSWLHENPTLCLWYTDIKDIMTSLKHVKNYSVSKLENWWTLNSYHSTWSHPWQHRGWLHVLQLSWYHQQSHSTESVGALSHLKDLKSPICWMCRLSEMSNSDWWLMSRPKSKGSLNWGNYLLSTFENSNQLGRCIESTAWHFLKRTHGCCTNFKQLLHSFAATFAVGRYCCPTDLICGRWVHFETWPRKGLRGTNELGTPQISLKIHHLASSQGGITNESPLQMVNKFWFPGDSCPDWSVESGQRRRHLTEGQDPATRVEVLWAEASTTQVTKMCA